jgi:hypothetical protein
MGGRSRGKRGVLWGREVVAEGMGQIIEVLTALGVEVATKSAI